MSFGGISYSLRLALSIGVGLGVGSVCQASGLIRAEGKFFKDSQDRVVFLRGVNLSNASKVPPFEAIRDDSQLEWLKGFGLNTIRLLFIWEAFEPEKGKYNLDYLRRLGKQVEIAAQQGVYTVVDFHSDAFSRYILGGCGSGFPKWAVPPSVSPSEPKNDESCSLWGLDAMMDYFIGGDVWNMSQAFFSDEFGARTRYLKAWRKIAKYFSKFPTVLGYDLLNEPWGDEVTQIAPLYEDAAKVIRAEDPKAILFVEPVVFTLTTLPMSDLPKPTFGNVAYAAHSYDITVLGSQSWFTGGHFIENGLQLISEKSLAWDAPVFVGEFGAPGTGAEMGLHMDFVYELLDHLMFSGAQWDFVPSWTDEAKDGWNMEDMTIVDPTGAIRPNFKPRPYPQAVSGEPLLLQVHYPEVVDERSFEFEWKHQPKLGVTEIIFPKRYFLPEVKMKIETSGAGLRCALNPSQTQITCKSPEPGVKAVRISSGS